jgi:hypothetical protein
MSSMFLFYGLHKVFGVLLGLGLVLFVLWANKQKADEIKKMAQWLVAVGILGMLILGLAGGSMYHKKGKYGERGMDKDGTTMMDGSGGMGEAMDEMMGDL